MTNYKNTIKLTLLFLSTLFFTNCSQKKNIVYFQNIDAISNLSQNKFEPTIQADDLLMIVVSSPDYEAAMPFNLETTMVPTVIGQAGLAQRQQQLYLVNKEGMIDFPVLGQLKLGGKTRDEITTMMKDKLNKYLKTPIVNIRIMNYKVTVQGEVTRPGSYTINSERITLPEALSLAGDLTIYGKRNNVLIIREIDGKKSINRVDLTKADFINSPFYYLSQNDYVYVEPNGAKSNSSTFNQNIPVWISLSSVLISLFLIFKN